MQQHFEDKVVVITGGGSGVGRALCQQFAAKGARIYAADINLAAAEDTVARLAHNKHAGRAVRLDVSETGSWFALRRQLEQETEGCDILCNNAGVFRVGKLLDNPVADWFLQSRINVDGVVLGCHALAPAMVRRGGGIIVNTASLSGLIAAPELSTYTASKFAVVGFSQALAQELAEDGVRVMVLAPGAIDTPMNHDVDVPLEDRLIPPAEVAAAVLEACSGATGQQYIFTHPEFYNMLAGSYQATLDEYRHYNESVDEVVA